MKPFGQGLAVAGLSLFALVAAGAASAQKSGGVLKIEHFDSPASMSILEESTRAALQPMMAVFNNLVVYDQNVKQNSLDSIVPDLATSWNWSEDGKELTFKLREGVKWHDGKPFTAADVKCTWDLLMGTGQDKLRVNPRKSWYNNLEAVTTNGDYEVTFRLKQPQPALLALLASGWSPIYPCHVAPAQMRQHPIGTGPFKFVEFKPNQSIKLVKNPDYWKQGRPYLDGIDFTIMREIAPRQSRFLCRRARCRYPVSRDPADAGGLQGAGAGCDLRVDLGQRAAHDADQYRQAALRQSRTAPGDDAGDRPRRVHRRSSTAARSDIGALDAAAAERRLGHARRKAARRCRATTPMSRKTGPRPAKS